MGMRKESPLNEDGVERYKYSAKAGRDIVTRHQKSCCLGDALRIFTLSHLARRMGVSSSCLGWDVIDVWDVLDRRDNEW